MTLDLPLPLGPTTEEKLCRRTAGWAPRGTVRATLQAVDLSPQGAHLVEGPHPLHARVGLEVLQLHLGDDQPAGLSHLQGHAARPLGIRHAQLSCRYGERTSGTMPRAVTADS